MTKWIFELSFLRSTVIEFQFVDEMIDNAPLAFLSTKVEYYRSIGNSNFWNDKYDFYLLFDRKYEENVS